MSGHARWNGGSESAWVDSQRRSSATSVKCAWAGCGMCSLDTWANTGSSSAVTWLRNWFISHLASLLALNIRVVGESNVAIHFDHGLNLLVYFLPMRQLLFLHSTLLILYILPVVREVELSGSSLTVHDSVIEIRDVDIVVYIWLLWDAWWTVLWLWNVVFGAEKWGVAVDLELIS